MRTLFAASLAVVLGSPTALIAQVNPAGMGAPKHEFGVDLGVAYSKASGCVGSCPGIFQVFTPVDVRIGLHPGNAMMIEPRFTFGLVSGGGSTLLSFDPGVNVLFRMGSGSGMHGIMGPYVTVGADVGIVSVSGGGNSTSGGVLGVNGGIGTRMPFGTAATRLEAFVGYKFKNTKLGSPNTLHLGVRMGLSLFH